MKIFKREREGRGAIQGYKKFYWIGLLVVLAFLLLPGDAAVSRNFFDSGEPPVITGEEAPPEEESLPEQETKTFGFAFVRHAGGITPEGITGSNSLEAIEHSYANGYRVMELDFCWTADDHLVCVHDWDAYYTKIGEDGVYFHEFEEARSSTYGFTSLTLDHLAEWMRGHRDVMIVMDVKERIVESAEQIAEKYPELQDSFCYQIYDEDEYEPIDSLGFQNIILTLYQMSWDEKTDTDAILGFAESHELVGITVSSELIGLIPGYADRLLEGKTPVFVHTVNEPEEQKHLFDLGISGIYTDYGETEPE